MSLPMWKRHLLYRWTVKENFLQFSIKNIYCGSILSRNTSLFVQFSIKSTKNLCFYGEIWMIVCITLIITKCPPHQFLWAQYLLYSSVSMDSGIESPQGFSLQSLNPLQGLIPTPASAARASKQASLASKQDHTTKEKVRRYASI